MLHSIDELFCTEYVYIEVVCTLIEVTVKYIYKVVYTLVIIVTECIRADCLCI